jgi:hypothetical protein
MRKIWKSAAILLIVAGISGALWALTVWNRYWDVLPRSPDPASGRIFPFSMRGVIVYETLQERSYLDRIEDLSAIAFYVGFALALAYRWRSGVWRKPEILNKGDHS